MTVVTNKSIFYHIPKTGGTWVGMAMRYSMRKNSDFVLRRPEVNYGNIDNSAFWSHLFTSLFPLKSAHTTQWNIKNEEKKGLFSFSFVRRHLSWYKSWWVNKTYVVARKKEWRTFLLDYAFDPNFERFIENVINMFPNGALTTIYKCFLGIDGKDLDFVGRQENLAEDLIKALTLAGEKFDAKIIRKLKKANTSASRSLDSRLTLNKKLERKLNTREKWITNTFYK